MYSLTWKPQPPPKGPLLRHRWAELAAVQRDFRPLFPGPQISAVVAMEFAMATRFHKVIAGSTAATAWHPHFFIGHPEGKVMRAFLKVCHYICLYTICIFASTLFVGNTSAQELVQIPCGEDPAGIIKCRYDCNMSCPKHLTPGGYEVGTIYKVTPLPGFAFVPNTGRCIIQDAKNSWVLNLLKQNTSTSFSMACKCIDTPGSNSFVHGYCDVTGKTGCYVPGFCQSDFPPGLVR